MKRHYINLARYASDSYKRRLAELAIDSKAPGESELDYDPRNYIVALETVEQSAHLIGADLKIHPL